MKTWHSYFDRAHARLNRSKRGSVLLLTLMVVVALTYIIATLLSSTVTEMKMNQRAQLTLEAKNAVESATEYAIAIVRQKFDNDPNISGNYFITNPITIPSNISSFLWNGTDVSPSNVTVTVGIVPTESLVYVDPTNPANTFDPARGKNITASDVYVYAKAIAANGWGKETAYGSQALEVRDAPLFTNAIFYNMDVEFSPGPAMTISGPVHCNGNIWAIAQTGLTFAGSLTASGNFNVGLIPYPTNWSTALSDTTDSGNLVYIPNTHGGYTTPFIGGNLNQQQSSSYWDSRQTNYSNTTYTNWREMSANLWGGSLQDSANSVPTEQVTGYNNYVFQVNGTSQDLDYAYSIIQPAQASNYTNGTANPFNLGEGEDDKFERNASIIVKVLAMGTANITQNVTLAGNVSTSNITANIDAGINATVNNFIGNGTVPTPGVLTSAANQTINVTVQYNNGTVASFNGTNGNLAWSNQTSANYSANSSSIMIVTQTQANNATGKPTLSSNLMELPANTHSGNLTSTGNTTRYVGFALVEFDTVNTTINATTNTLQPVYNATTQVTDAQGDVLYPGDVQINPIAVNPALISNVLSFQPGIGNMTTGTNGVGNSSGYTGNVSDVWGGMYDARRGTTVATLSLNVGALKNYVDNNTANYSSNTSAFFDGTGALAYNASNQYNGVVYVEFPELPGNSSRIPNATNNLTVGNTTYPADDVLTSIGGNMGGQNVGLVLYGAQSSNVTANSTVTGVPNPNYANTTEGTVGRVAGFTVATNNCVYVDGSFNADGNMSTPKSDTTGNQTFNSTMPDSGNMSNPDPVCCIAGDSLTILSNNFNFRKSATEDTAAATEVNAAIIAGICPAIKYSSTQQSGGNHNFPRFLENWGSVDFRYRGSMVCLYESEIADQPWAQGYYSAPNREWGFYQSFANGVYPPGTPDSRSYYRVNFSYMTAAAYTTAINAL